MFYYIKDNRSCTLLYGAESQFEVAKERDPKAVYPSEAIIFIRKMATKIFVIIVIQSADRM